MSEYDYIPKLYDVHYDAPETDRQSDEFFWATVDGRKQRFNIHDYATLYRVPWLYDIALYHNLVCRTPTEMSAAIDRVWKALEVDRSKLRALELGAGSGAFGHELRHTLHIPHLEAIDICPEAAEAAMRDRAGLYDAYHIDDLTKLSPTAEVALSKAAFNVVAMASATGWGNHIPLAGFETSFDLLVPGGWYIFHVKPNDPDPECIELCAWVANKVESGAMDQKYRGSHFHRKSSNGSDIYYDVVVGVKR
jgi:SAM-dependent methyltransferase